MDLISVVEKEIIPVKRNISFEIGDTVKVHYKIVEGERERVQIFEGIVIAISNKGINKTFTVRKLSFGVGVERIFPFYSPRIVKIETIRKGKKRRAKLYFLRDRKGKAAKLKERKGAKIKANNIDQSEVVETKLEPEIQAEEQIQAEAAALTAKEVVEPTESEALAEETQPAEESSSENKDA